MDLDRTTCRRARLARDARFDGRFFVAVKTTGVFCRPICPAVPPQERNVEYFPTAAAASEAGFRACLRCRPECAPGTPAWTGASTTVARALRLIGDGALEEDGIDRLAARLGVGARHLRRLFVEHLGASPIAIAQTRRLLSAKRLIDETEIPLTTVAMASGFGSIRRFNSAFLASYGRSPRELRQAVLRSPRSEVRTPRQAGRNGHRMAPGQPRALYSFQLRYRPPFDWETLLAFLAPRAIPGVEAIDAGTYRRSIEIDGKGGWLEVTRRDPAALTLSIGFPEPRDVLRIVSRVRHLFDLDADPMTIDRHLAADTLLAPLVRRRPGMRVPGAWDGFELGVRAILGQQVSVAAATPLAGRLVARVGRPRASGVARLTHCFPSPADLATAPVEQIGVPKKRADAIRAFAAAVARGAVCFDAAIDPDHFRRALRELPGIGDWTAEYIALRALGDPDAFPSGDLGLRRATGISSARKLSERAQAWRPWRGYAALHLWQGATK